MPKRVLIVDESPLVRAGLKAVLATEPDLVICAEAGTRRETLQLTGELRPNLVITDLTLPDSAGLDLIRGLRARVPEVRILVCSLYDERLFAGRVVRAGALGFVDKRESIEQVIAAVHRVLADQVYLSQAMVERVLAGLAGRRPYPCDLVDQLSDREFEVFGLIGQGLATRLIAQRLRLIVKTIESHREKIKYKLDLPDAAALTRCAVQWSLDPTLVNRRFPDRPDPG